VARNRKRAKDRRTRRPAQPGSARRGVPTATHEPDLEPRQNGLDPVEENGVPDPLDHATPDVELADAQLAFGRPAESEPGDEAGDEELELEAEESIRATARGGRRGGGGGDDLDGAVAEAGAPGPAHAEHRAAMPVRLIGFLEGCWRELQRVQWPDRRQVMQATGVVIGFVIIAAAFLGLADFVSGKLVTFILK
jgi:preprotein translocase SecE subunit